MSTEQHEALKLADELGEMFDQLDPVDDWRPVVDESRNALRDSHALIVQMAEALAGAKSSLDDYNCGAPWGAYDQANLRCVEAANTDATQYLNPKGQK